MYGLPGDAVKARLPGACAGDAGMSEMGPGCSGFTGGETEFKGLYSALNLVSVFPGYCFYTLVEVS